MNNEPLLLKEKSQPVLVPVGPNTISFAVRNMKQGDIFELMPGNYVQTESIVIPEGITMFSLIGKGIGVSNIYFHDSDGIRNKDTRIRFCRISEITFLLNISEPGTPYTGITLMGEGGISGESQGVMISDVSFEMAEGSKGGWSGSLQVSDVSKVLI